MVKNFDSRPPGPGPAVFRFGGMGDLRGAELGLPLLPIRIASPLGQGGRILNAVLDSGSHRTVLPFEVSEKIGLADLEFNESLGTPVGRLKTAPAVVRLDVLDSHFPSVVHWSFDELSVEIAEPSSNLPLPLVGWDLLHQFEACFNRQDGYILLRKLTVPS